MLILEHMQEMNGQNTSPNNEHFNFLAYVTDGIRPMSARLTLATVDFFPDL